MADIKWIDDLVGDMPFAAAARHALGLRLSTVGDRLPLAVFHSDQDREYVHQLRVSTRRAGAAVRMFGECLPNRQRKAIAGTLKRIRRTAGEARDWDVFQDMISQRLARATATHKPAFDFLLGFGQGRRAVAQDHLAKLSKLATAEYESLLAETIGAIESSEIGTFRSHAVPWLTGLLHELDAAATSNLQDYERLHQVRILGKKLRYAMEIFASCFEPAFRDKVYPAVEEMQEILGRANDSHVAIGRLHEIRARLEMTQPKEWPRFRAGLESLLRSHQRRLPEQRRLFLAWWQEWQSSGLEKRLEKMLRG